MEEIILILETLSINHLPCEVKTFVKNYDITAHRYNQRTLIGDSDSMQSFCSGSTWVSRIFSTTISPKNGKSGYLVNNNMQTNNTSPNMLLQIWVLVPIIRPMEEDVGFVLWAVCISLPAIPPKRVSQGTIDNCHQRISSHPCQPYLLPTIHKKIDAIKSIKKIIMIVCDGVCFSSSLFVLETIGCIEGIVIIVIHIVM